MARHRWYIRASREPGQVWLSERWLASSADVPLPSRAVAAESQQAPKWRRCLSGERDWPRIEPVDITPWSLIGITVSVPRPGESVLGTEEPEHRCVRTHLTLRKR